MAGPAAIEGCFTERVEATRTRLYTGRQRDALKLGALAALAAGALTELRLAAERRR